MIANYHTHTFFCRHATGTQREYIERAIDNGLKILGFSDHVPMPIPNKPQGRYRVQIEDLPYYMWILENLREEYKGKIQILIGFEAEYYADCFSEMCKILNQYSYDYLILGQHYIDGEDPEHYVPRPTTEYLRLKKYVDEIISGLQTGKFTYLAHPDLINYQHDDIVYRTEMKRLCQACFEMDIPLEFNLLGFQENRNYPCKKFFEIVAEVGNSVVLGCDAHKIEDVAKPDTLLRANEFLSCLGIVQVDTVKIRNPKNE